MAAGDTTIGTDTTFTFDGDATYKITSIGWDGLECGTVNASHMKTADWHEFLACDLTDPGEITIEGQLKADRALVVGNSGTLTILFPEGTTWTVTAIVTSWILYGDSHLR